MPVDEQVAMCFNGTHIKIKVQTVDKPRYQMRKGGIATNMLGVCTIDIHFVYVLPGWEGSVADGQVLRDAISRRHGLKVLHDTGFKAGYLNELEKMLEKVLSNAMLKAKPNLESRIKTLKRDWSIVYDMLSGKIIAALFRMNIDRATRKDTQTATDIIKEIDVKDVATTNTHEERNDFHGCEADVSLDDMDLSATQPQ
ncbi:hypothetical protein J1N35_026842 [Gossypium stocksii]|uniref:DDE Tnp4 domain-containing protein n=1 Tax=Gossypium stocksii TaxID=47602 RepID=A0A9D3V981_9ROSI|nr:hypothetical protein J1N35_026842 [Gossypium stocksii]